ncbi:hypothetical protein YUBABA_01940 [Serratia phage vB_SmaM-Yubaba]|nr:hypothetical protein SUREIYA_00410 [Serratia phage vB_SmaM-Sureiya]UQT03396.1 hypothetical protein YUBABA_01940 [Serratia phage vB_SmaM-Yubaba]
MKTVTISLELLQRLVDAAYDFHPANPAADEGQEIINKATASKAETFNDKFLEEVIVGERHRQLEIVRNWSEQNGVVLTAKPAEGFMVVPTKLARDVVDHISAGHDHCDESLELLNLVKVAEGN